MYLTGKNMQKHRKTEKQLFCFHSSTGREKPCLLRNVPAKTCQNKQLVVFLWISIEKIQRMQRFSFFSAKDKKMVSCAKLLELLECTCARVSLNKRFFLLSRDYNNKLSCNKSPNNAELNEMNQYFIFQFSFVFLAA